MSLKPKVAFYWCASCGGCEESVVDLAEGLLAVAEAVDIVFWPVAMDFKKEDVEALGDREVVASFINGAVRTSEQEEMAKLLRRKSQVVIAYGSCAHMGGIPGLANQFSRDEILKFVYDESPSTKNVAGVRPLPLYGENGGGVRLPRFDVAVRALDQVVDVDYYLPGCPPTPALLQGAVEALLSGKLPAKGSVLAPDIALCDECPRKESKPEDMQIERFRRVPEGLLDAEQCLLAQGVVCMGPATRGGCGASCISGNMPCTGCFGGTSGVRDQGAKAFGAIVSLLGSRKAEEVDSALDSIPDPVGTFYRYGLPVSLLAVRAPKEGR